MRISRNLFITTLAVVAFSFTACDKENQQNDSDTGMVSDFYKGQKEADDLVVALNATAIENGVMRVDEAFGVQSTLLPECADVLIDTVSSPRTITIDFGPTGCLCSDWDSKTRKGKIVASWSGKYRQPGTVIQVTTQDYFVNGNKHELNKTVTNNGYNTDGHLTYSVNVSLAKVTYTDGTTLNWTSNRTREWMQGEQTLTPYDDVYHISGTATGTARNGDPFTVSITSPLEIALSCNYVRKGTMIITPGTKPARTVDFGNGQCDAQATVEINGTVYSITL